MRRRVATLLLSVFIIAGVAAPMQVALADQLSDAQAQKKQYDESAQGHKDKKNEATAAQQQARAELAILYPKVAATQRQLDQENVKLDGIMVRIDHAQQDLAAKQAEEAQRKDLLNRRIRSLYKENGNTSFLDAALSSRSFSELVDRFMVMRDIAHSDEVLLQQIQQDRAAIEALKAQLSQQRDEQAATTRRKTDQTNALNAQVVQQKNLEQQASSTATVEEAQQNRAQASSDAVAAEIAVLSARGGAHSSGVFAWPGVQGPITQPFGCTDLVGEPRPKPPYSCPRSRPWFHEGIDIGGPMGAEIDAADGGIAYTRYDPGGYGQWVFIDHGNGLATVYGHMLAYAIHPGPGGQQVAKGQAIGYEGSTGFSTGAHLHFGVYRNGQPVDPCQYVGC